MVLRGHRRDPLDIGEVGVSGRLGHPHFGEREWIKLDTGLRTGGGEPATVSAGVGGVSGRCQRSDACCTHDS